MIPELFIDQTLQLQDGDIFILESPYLDATEKDMFPFNPRGFEPTHSMLWIAGHDHPLAHSVREGYRLPGARLTRLPEGKCFIFRSTTDSGLAKMAADVMQNWALSERLYSKKDYLATYPAAFWRERQRKDLKNFYTNEHTIISGPSTPYPEPRASIDMADLIRNPELMTMGEEGLRRAIKFASRKNTVGQIPISKGQRCTPLLVAAYQAAVLAPIVKDANKQKLPFKQFKGKSFEEYADEVLVEGWMETEIGSKLLEARKSGDYRSCFTSPFTVDQRYSTPKTLLDSLKSSPEYEVIGTVSYFNAKMEVLDKAGAVTRLDTTSDSPPSSPLTQ